MTRQELVTLQSTYLKTAKEAAAQIRLCVRRLETEIPPSEEEAETLCGELSKLREKYAEIYTGAKGLYPSGAKPARGTSVISLVETVASPRALTQEAFAARKEDVAKFLRAKCVNESYDAAFASDILPLKERLRAGIPEGEVTEEDAARMLKDLDAATTFLRVLEEPDPALLGQRMAEAASVFSADLAIGFAVGAYACSEAEEPIADAANAAQEAPGAKSDADTVNAAAAGGPPEAADTAKSAKSSDTTVIPHSADDAAAGPGIRADSSPKAAKASTKNRADAKAVPEGMPDAGGSQGTPSVKESKAASKTAAAPAKAASSAASSSADDAGLAGSEVPSVSRKGTAPSESGSRRVGTSLAKKAKTRKIASTKAASSAEDASSEPALASGANQNSDSKELEQPAATKAGAPLESLTPSNSGSEEADAQAKPVSFPVYHTESTVVELRPDLFDSGEIDVLLDGHGGAVQPLPRKFRREIQHAAAKYSLTRPIISALARFGAIRTGDLFDFLQLTGQLDGFEDMLDGRDLVTVKMIPSADGNIAVPREARSPLSRDSAKRQETRQQRLVSVLESLIPGGLVERYVPTISLTHKTPFITWKLSTYAVEGLKLTYDALRVQDSWPSPFTPDMLDGILPAASFDTDRVVHDANAAHAFVGLLTYCKCAGLPSANELVSSVSRQNGVLCVVPPSETKSYQLVSEGSLDKAVPGLPGMYVTRESFSDPPTEDDWLACDGSGIFRWNPDTREWERTSRSMPAEEVSFDEDEPVFEKPAGRVSEEAAEPASPGAVKTYKKELRRLFSRASLAPTFLSAVALAGAVRTMDLLFLGIVIENIKIDRHPNSEVTPELIEEAVELAKGYRDAARRAHVGLVHADLLAVEKDESIALPSSGDEELFEIVCSLTPHACDVLRAVPLTSFAKKSRLFTFDPDRLVPKQGATDPDVRYSCDMMHAVTNLCRHIAGYSSDRAQSAIQSLRSDAEGVFTIEVPYGEDLRRLPLTSLDYPDRADRTEPVVCLVSEERLDDLDTRDFADGSIIVMSGDENPSVVRGGRLEEFGEEYILTPAVPAR